MVQHTIVSLNSILSAKKLKIFSYYKVYFDDIKLIFMYKANQILVGVFKENTNNQFCKLILMHIYVALLNFKSNINDKLSCLNCGLSNSMMSLGNNNNVMNLNRQDTFQTLDILVNQNNAGGNAIGIKRENINSNFYNILLKGEFTFSDYVELKIFEKYFLKYLLIHFSKNLNSISSKEELFLTNIKLKNVFYVDLQEEKIIFDYKKMNSNNNKISLKFYQNKHLWSHLMFLLKNLEIEYNKEINNSEKRKDYQFYRNFDNSSFIKFECTSTYPRYSFFLKYLPILGGLGIIHAYSQKKLSRQYDNYGDSKNYYSTQTLLSPEIRPKKKYYEFKTIVNMISNQQQEVSTTEKNLDDSNNKTGINFQNNQYIKYLEPKPILNIEKFFCAFFIALNPQKDIYYTPTENATVKYFNMEIIEAINSISNTYIKEQSLDEIFQQINVKLKNLYAEKSIGNISVQVAKNQQKKRESEDDLSKKFDIGKHYLFIDLFESPTVQPKYKYSNSNSNQMCSNGSYNTNKENNTILSKATFSPLKNNLNDYLKKMKNINSCDYEFTKKYPPVFGLNKKSPIKKNNQQTSNINELSNTSFSLSKWDDNSKEDITINLSRKISDINGNSNPLSNYFPNNNHGEKYYNLRKVSFFDDFKNDNTRLEDDPLVSKDYIEHNDNGGVSLIAANGDASPLSSNNNNNGILHLGSSKEKKNESVPCVKYSSLKLGKFYSKDLANHKLKVSAINDDSYGKVLTFQKDT